ncbi:MAG: Uncharacterized protein XD97_0193 [Pelotomaculum thermopropionicum]|uniref:DUF2232 domain-containing protein n=1 Tax=Pelotomaculum thermopropionicum TaxID=110500 RepID=A0A101HU58_9FIRM|nr:MAG: Uncharacterized protein XD97_0193 [Pelotomaculum thermopropionicum]
MITITGKNKPLREWVLFSFLLVAAGLFSMIIPPLSFLVKIAFPVPLILLVLKLDSRYGFLGLTIAAIPLLLLAPDRAVMVAFVVKYGLLGILYGLLLKNYVSPGKSMATGVLGASLLALISSGLIYALTGENPFILSQEGRQAVEQWLLINQNAGAFKDLPPETQEVLFHDIIELFELFIPGQFIVTSAFEAVLTYLLARVLLRRLKYPALTPGVPFSGISFPWYIIWGLIAGLSLTLAGDQFSAPLIAKTGKNILFILFYVYLFSGLSVVVYFYQKSKLAGLLKVLLVMLAIVYIPFSMVIVLLLGVADPLVGFRRLTLKK